MRTLEAEARREGRTGVPLLRIGDVIISGAQPAAVMADALRRPGTQTQLSRLIQGIRFTDGIEVIGNSAAPQAQAAA